MTTEPVRQPKGIRVGGRFAEKQNSPSPVALDLPQDAAGPGLNALSEARDEAAETAKIDIDAAMAMAAPQSAPAAPDVAEMAEARDALMEKWEDHPRDSPDFEHIDQQMQHAAVQLAAAAVRRDYPAAKTLVIRENEDGENQYDPIAVNDGSGRPIVDLEDDDDWTRDEVAGENTVNLSELSWTLNLEDDAWAGGIAEISTTKRDGKTAMIDIDAALAKPAPQRPTSKAALVQRYADAQDATAAARRQHRAAREIDQHAAVQLAAASILERYPEADTLHLRENVDEPGGAIYVHSLSGPGGEIAHSNDGDDFQYQPGEDGTPDLAELLRDLDTSSMTWCEGISEVENDKYNGYQVALNLKAALAKPAPSSQV